MEPLKEIITPEIIKQLKKKGADKKMIEKLEKLVEKKKSTELSIPEGFQKEFFPVVKDYIKVEKNLESIGFFTPSSKRIKEIFEKKKTQTKTIDGKEVKVSVEIIASHRYGLPITIDLDIYRAFEKILNRILQREGKIENPITFSSAEIIKLMGKKRRHGGELYKEIRDWLSRMLLTGVQTNLYLTQRKAWVTDTFHIFERRVAFGKELEPGVIADKNYVWLSQWYLENLNHQYIKYLDYELYKKLRKPIAKSLYGILDIAFYASGGQPVTKRYDELCKEFLLTQHKELSLIRRQLEPAHKELKENQFLDNTRENPTYKKTKDGTTYNITYYPGPKYFEDQIERIRRRHLRRKKLLNNQPLQLQDPQNKNNSKKEIPDWIKNFEPQNYQEEQALKIAKEFNNLEDLAYYLKIFKEGPEAAIHLAIEEVRTSKNIKSKPALFRNRYQFHKERFTKLFTKPNQQPTN